MRAAIYARVSTERQEREQTVASQVSALASWVRARDYALADEHVYVDEGASGARLDRPALDRLRDAAAEGEFEVLAVLAPDRLARKYAYQVVLLEELRRAGCAVVFLQRPISDDPDDQLLLQIQGAVAEYERAVLYERFRRGKLQKARAGQYLGSNPPYGYRYVPKRDGVPGHLVVDPGEAELVRQLYRWLVDERLTSRQLVKRLNASAWRPRSGRRFWSVCVVHGILSRPVYVGTAYANRTVTLPADGPAPGAGLPGGPPRRRRRPPEEWIPVPVPALVDQATFDAAQAQLARNAALSYRHNTTHPYLLRCLLTCGASGRGMTGNLRRATATAPEYRYYVCYGKDALLSLRDAPCPRQSVKAAELEAAVWAHVTELLSDPARLLTQFRALGRAAAAGDAREQAEAGRLRARLERLGRQEQRLLDAYQAEVISLPELAGRRTQLTAQRRALLAQQAQAARTRNERAHAQAVLTDLERFCARIHHRLHAATFAERRAILELLLERVVVGEGTLEIRHVIRLPPDPDRPASTDPAPDGGLRLDGKDRPHQAHDGPVVGEAAHHVGAALHLAVQALQRVVAPHLAPVLGREGEGGQDVRLRVVEQGGQLGEAGAEAVRHPAPLLAGARRVGLDEHGADRRRHHLLGAAGHQRAGVPDEVDSAPLPPGAVQDGGDGALEPLVGVADHRA